MAQYNLEKSGRSSRRVEIKKGGFQFHPGAFLLAFLLAALVWMYMEGSDLRQAQVEAEGGNGETVLSVDRHDITNYVASV